MAKIQFTKKEIEDLHSKNFGSNGKLEIISKVPVVSAKDLSLAYTPGVAHICREIVKDESNYSKYTSSRDIVAVLSDGTAVLGLGDIGTKGAMPVMEGKSVLFKMFAGVDAFPLCVDTKDIDKIVELMKLLEVNFGGVNIEDVNAPRCFILEEKLKKELKIPIFHDDQHGTAIVVLGGLVNALKIAGKELKNSKIVVNGIGAAGVAITKLLKKAGAENMVLCDRFGVLDQNDERFDEYRREFAYEIHGDLKGSLQDALTSADVFIGVSAADVLTVDMISSMKENPIIFAMANPDPEIKPELAVNAGVKLLATGRSDYPNQINNVLGFPGIFRGVLEVRAKSITDEMKLAAAYALSNLISDVDIKSGKFIPSPLNKEVVPEVAFAVAEKAIEQNLSENPEGLQGLKERVREFVSFNENRYSWMMKKWSLNESSK